MQFIGWHIIPGRPIGHAASMAQIAAGNIYSKQAAASNSIGIGLGWRELEGIPIGAVELNNAPNKIIVQEIGYLHLVQCLYFCDGAAGIHLKARTFNHPCID